MGLFITFWSLFLGLFIFISTSIYLSIFYFYFFYQKQNCIKINKNTWKEWGVLPIVTIIEKKKRINSIIIQGDLANHYGLKRNTKASLLVHTKLLLLLFNPFCSTCWRSIKLSNIERNVFENKCTRSPE